jgi:hypothetical protein
MKHQPVPQPKTLTHIYVRDAQKGFVRPCWSSGGVVYCGMCMRGEVQAETGSVCPICASTVERILEVADGDSPKFTRRRNACSIRVGAARTNTGKAVLLDFTTSQGVSA